jgi:hypothetical protein
MPEISSQKRFKIVLEAEIPPGEMHVRDMWDVEGLLAEWEKAVQTARPRFEQFESA